MEVSLNYCSQNGGNVYRTPYYNGNPNIGPRIDSNLGRSPCVFGLCLELSGGLAPYRYGLKGNKANMAGAGAHVEQ